MTSRTIETSPQLYARIGGALYLIIIVIGLYGEAFVRDRLIVSGDAAATAANIVSHESLWRFHIAAELFLLMCAVALLLILYALLRPVSRDVMLLAVFFNLVAIVIEAATTMRLLEALFPLGNAGYLKAFTPEQLYAMASPVAQIAWLWLWREPALLRLFLRHCRIPDLQVGISPKEYRRSDADRRRVLSDQ